MCVGDVFLWKLLEIKMQEVLKETISSTEQFCHLCQNVATVKDQDAFLRHLTVPLEGATVLWVWSETVTGGVTGPTPLRPPLFPTSFHTDETVKIRTI